MNGANSDAFFGMMFLASALVAAMTHVPDASFGLLALSAIFFKSGELKRCIERSHK